MSTVSLTAAKQFLQISHTEQDSIISALLEHADSFVEQICGIKLTRITTTEYFQGGSRVLRPSYRPVVRIIEVRNVVSDTALDSDDYVLYQNSVYKRDGSEWSFYTPYGWSISYEGGYNASTLPAGISLGILHLVYHWFWNRGGKTSFGAEGLSTSWSDLPAVVRSYLGPFRSVDTEVG